MGMTLSVEFYLGTLKFECYIICVEVKKMLSLSRFFFIQFKNIKAILVGGPYKNK